MADARTTIVAVANWCVPNKGLFNYAEDRPFPLYLPTPARHITNDCSATVTLIYYLAGAADPNVMGFDGYGNTDSLAAHGAEVTLSGALPGDLVIYYEGAATVHTAAIVDNVPAAGQYDPLTVSHGQQSEPAFVRVSDDGRVHKFFRFNTDLAFPGHVPSVFAPPPVLARTRTARASLLGRLVWNTTLDFGKVDHVTVKGDGSKKAVAATDAGGHLRVRVTGATPLAQLVIDVYAKGA